MIKFSVIIPNYNHAAFLKERIESVLSQSYQDFELIILDDCSTDNSRDIIEEYRQHPKVSHIVYAEKNSGSPFKQWKKGLTLAKGDWIWIAESDDCSTPDFLETGNFFIEKNPSAGLFYCDAFINTGDSNSQVSFSTEKNNYFKTKKWSEEYFITGTQEVRECLGIRCTINNASSTLMRKDLIDACINNVSTFRFHGDWYCYLSLAEKDNIVYSPKAMNHYRLYSSGITSKLPEDGKHKKECFRILIYLYQQFQIHRYKQTLEQFVLLNLSTGILSGFINWVTYFKLNKKIAWRVFLIHIRHRIGLSKKMTL